MKKQPKKMRTALDAGLINAFKEMYPDEADLEKAVKDARKTFSFFRQEALSNENMFAQDHE
jgi:hypothetical protein